MNSLDRTADGSARKCDECEREFKGEAWQDYCAECHARLEENSPLKAPWACLTCNETFPIGEVRPGSTPLGDHWPCPRCGSRTITPADKSIRETDVYYGPIGTRN